MSRSGIRPSQLFWSSVDQSRRVRRLRVLVLFSVFALALGLSASSAEDVVNRQSVMGLVLLLAGTAATYAPAFARAEMWVLLAVPLLDLAAIGGFHMVPGGTTVSFLIVGPAAWLGSVAGRRGVAITMAATLVFFLEPGSAGDSQHGGWVEIVLTVVMAGLASGAAVFVVSAWNDRLEQLAAARALVDAHHAHIGAIFETVPVGLVEVGPDGAYQVMNDRHREFVALGYPDGHTGQVGQLGHLYAKDNRTPLERDQIPSVRAMSGETFSGEILWVGADADQRRAVSVSARPVPSVGAIPASVVLAYNDVTELMHALRVKDDFVASVSHELRTPLTSIIGYLDLALDLVHDSGATAPAGMDRCLTVSRRNADRLLLHVTDLLAVAHAQRVPMKLHRAETDLSGLVQQTIDETSTAASTASVRLATRIHPVPTAMVDGVRIQQVMENLLSNAVKYTPPGGTVTTSLTQMGSEALLEVIDTGTGISTADQHNVFDKFFRASNAASSNIPGLGVGLAVCKEIVAAHDGRIEVTSVVGVGTRMRVYLPLEAETQGPVPPDVDRRTAAA